MRTLALCACLAALAAAPAAAQTKKWTLNSDFDSGTLNNVQHVPPDQIVLGRTPVSQQHVVYSTNYYPGFVVQIDTLTGKQTARFDSALQSINGQATGARPAQEVCDWGTLGNCPGRVAVDTNGDVWIVNRAFGNQGTLSKFTANLAHCIDRNNNGVIDMNPANGEYFGQLDECILTTIPVGPVNAWPRGVAVDKWGKVWVSTFNEGKVYRFNPNEPVALEATVTVGGTPYSMAAGGDYLFVSNAAGQTARVHVTTLAVDYAPCPGTYGVVADPSGQVAWLGSYFAGTSGIYRADFTNHTCTLMSNGVAGITTAVTLDINPGGPYVWAANYNNATVSKFTTAGTLLGTYAAGGSQPHGLSVDFQGNLWVVVDSPPLMTKLNPATGALLGSYSIGFLAAQAGSYNATPYLYSDFTGVQLDRQSPYTKVGAWDGVYDGGRNGLAWSKVTWNTEPQGAVPANTTLTLSARAADTVPALGVAGYVPVVNGAALSGLVGRYVQVRAALTGPGWVTPILSDVTVAGPCATVGEACCVADADCDDGNACTTDTCPAPGGACAHTPIADCCLTAGDCDDANPCTTDSCPGAGATCLHDAVAGCCRQNGDCADGNACTVDLCSGVGGTCSNPAIAGCCNVHGDCTSPSVCATATCTGTGGVCVLSPISGCCASDAACDDLDPCTVDTCTLATGECANAAVAGCCRQDADCSTGVACMLDECTGPGGVCTANPISGCCSSDPDCDTQNPCRLGTCTTASGTCAIETVPDCCAIDADCDDANPCTVDTCPAPGGACQNVPADGCCLHDTDCDDGDACTRDTCSFPGGACQNEAIAHCCRSRDDCPAGAACQGGLCVTGGVLDGGWGDAGTTGGADGGCGCRTTAPATAPGALGALLLLGLLAGRRRRP